jgi:DNA-binding ferritin-like protein (Dps family)
MWRMETTDIRIPANILALLEATAFANGYEPEEVIIAAIEAFLESEHNPPYETER